MRPVRAAVRAARAARAARTSAGASTGVNDEGDDLCEILSMYSCQEAVIRLCKSCIFIRSSSVLD